MAAAAVAIAAAVIAISEATGTDATSTEAATAGAAALRAVGGGEVTSVERASDGNVAWRVDVVQGSQRIEVALDSRQRALTLAAEPIDEEPPDDGLVAIAEQFEYREGVKEELREDRQLPRAKRRKAAAAARSAMGGGRVLYVERSEDPGEAYEVDLTKNSKEYEVFLDRRFEVIRRQGPS